MKKEEKESPFPLFSLERAAARSLGSLPVVASLSYLFLKIFDENLLKFGENLVKI